MAVDPFHAAGNAFFASLQALTWGTAATSYLTCEDCLVLALVMLPLAQLFRKRRCERESRGEALVVKAILQAVGRAKSALTPTK
jgi:hypothetical protein